MQSQYEVPVTRCLSEVVIKNSRFIGTLEYCNSRVRAMVIINQTRNRYPKASHHCWAMIAGSPDDLHSMDQSDDGEPRGTAGKPMLNLLHHSGLGHVVAVVSRSFGGTKLGTGGLVRAYSQTTRELLDDVVRKTWVSTESVKISVPFDCQNAVENFLKKEAIIIESRTYWNLVSFELKVPIRGLETIGPKLQNICQGNMVVD
ncbi:MAG: putative YigZ family protein [Gammaproteobacteria bacterium]|jgi:uncharacterized YigZ family protein